jgi:tetratricopeptide (TPR) repeat protein
MSFPHEPASSGKSIELLRAIAHCDEKLRFNPMDATAYNNRGFARYNLGDLTGAEDDYNAALALNPLYPEAYNNRGALRHARGDCAGAVGDYSQALRLRADYAEAYNNRGAARCGLGDHDGAIADLTAALQLKPGKVEAYHNRALARDGKWDHAGSAADFDKALECLIQTPETASRRCLIHIYRAHAHYHLRSRAAFLADYHHGFGLNRDLGASTVIRVLETQARKDLAGALVNCAQHLQSDPGDFPTYARRGLLLLLAGRDAEAQADLDRFYHYSPNDETEPILGVPITRLVDEVRQRRRTQEYREISFNP